MTLYMPTVDEIDRVVAGHAIELAIGFTHEPDMVLEVAKMHFGNMLGKNSAWPTREILH